MRFVIQRVTHASVTVDKQVVGAIDKGLMVLIGVSNEDNQIIADKMIKKLLGLRIFEDSEGKTNLDLQAVDGQLLLISQFTLYADCKKGNRPSFIRAGKPDYAKLLYEYILEVCGNLYGKPIYCGEFGADMKVSLINDGPFTVILDSAEII